MPRRNSNDIALKFTSAMERAGISPTEPILAQLVSGEFVHFRAQGDKPNRRNGWAVLFVDGLTAGAFGHHRLSIHEKWKFDTQADRLTHAEQKNLALEMQKRARIRAAQKKERHCKARATAA